MRGRSSGVCQLLRLAAVGVMAALLIAWPRSAPVLAQRAGTGGLDLVLLIDQSDSMGYEHNPPGPGEAPSDREKLRFSAARLFVDLGTPSDRFGILLFADHTGSAPGLDPKLVAADPSGLPRLRNAIDDAGRAPLGLETNMAEALDQATAMLEGRSDAASRPAYVLLLTDGVPTLPKADPTGTTEAAARRLKERTQAVVVPILLGTDVNRKLMDNVAGADGEVLPANTAEDLLGVYARLASRLRPNLYLNQLKDEIKGAGDTRSVQVRVDADQRIDQLFFVWTRGGDILPLKQLAPAGRPASAGNCPVADVPGVTVACQVAKHYQLISLSGSSAALAGEWAAELRAAQELDGFLLARSALTVDLAYPIAAGVGELAARYVPAEQPVVLAASIRDDQGTEVAGQAPRARIDAPTGRWQQPLDAEGLSERNTVYWKAANSRLPSGAEATAAVQVDSHERPLRLERTYRLIAKPAPVKLQPLEQSIGAKVEGDSSAVRDFTGFVVVGPAGQRRTLKVPLRHAGGQIVPASLPAIGCADFAWNVVVQASADGALLPLYAGGNVPPPAGDLMLTQPQGTSYQVTGDTLKVPVGLRGRQILAAVKPVITKWEAPPGVPPGDPPAIAMAEPGPAAGDPCAATTEIALSRLANLKPGRYRAEITLPWTNSPRQFALTLDAAEANVVEIGPLSADLGQVLWQAPEREGEIELRLDREWVRPPDLHASWEPLNRSGQPIGDRADYPVLLEPLPGQAPGKTFRYRLAVGPRPLTHALFHLGNDAYRGRLEIQSQASGLTIATEARPTVSWNVPSVFVRAWRASGTRVPIIGPKLPNILWMPTWRFWIVAVALFVLWLLAPGTPLQGTLTPADGGEPCWLGAWSTAYVNADGDQFRIEPGRTGRPLVQFLPRPPTEEELDQMERLHLSDVPVIVVARPFEGVTLDVQLTNAYGNKQPAPRDGQGASQLLDQAEVTVGYADNEGTHVWTAEYQPED